MKVKTKAEWNVDQLKRTNSLIKKNEKKKEEPTFNQESRKVIKQRKKVQQQELKTRNVPLIVKYSQLLSDEPGEERFRLQSERLCLWA
ncbi:hypothetical protein BC833DRAFT_654147 [Globomyces pollinis-pini]|nr:hypothetical protein BC833DRAFT_654147 [Globomyces pollinis-pini]